MKNIFAISVLVCCAALSVSAAIVGPYTSDANTLHLWHLDEVVVPAVDSAPGGTNLTGLGNGATLGNTSLTGFGKALSTAGNINAYFATKTLANGIADDTAMTLTDPTTGAFTYEAIVRTDFNPATFTRSLVLYIITAENDANQATTRRAFQFYIAPRGAVQDGSPTSEFRLQFFNSRDNVSYSANIPTNGPNAIISNHWYHAAVTYDGNDSTPGNLKLYWTAMDPSRIKADLLPGSESLAMPDMNPNTFPDFTLGNVGRYSTPTPGPNSSFPGLIDEVRMSKNVRSPVEMMFNSANVVIVESPTNHAVPVGQPFSLSVLAAGTPPLFYQWRTNGVAISGATLPTLSIGSAQAVHAADYDVVVNNSFSAATSAVATITVADPKAPRLRGRSAKPNLVLYWPAFTQPMVLEVTTNLTPPVVWSPVTNDVVIDPENFTVTVPNLGGAQYFRLLGVTNPPSTAVRAVDWSMFTAGPPTDPSAQLAGAILNNACKYGLTTWWDTVRNYDAQDASYYLNLGGTTETYIRGPGLEAFGLAVALKTGVYDPGITGVPATTAQDRMMKMARSLGYNHVVNKAGGWGNVWQSALWASIGGTAAWMNWTNFSAPDQELIRRMVEYEANRFNDYVVPYYQDRFGAIIYPGDTKSEENAWNASVVHLAICMMPNHPNVTLWWNKSIELYLSTFAAPSDLNRTNIYHGRPLSWWLNGANINEDGTLFNHNIMHPEYMVSGLSEFQPAWWYMLAGKPAPRAGLFNIDRIYGALVDLNLVAGTAPYPVGGSLRAPGGYMYMRNGANQPTPEVYFPQGNDWGYSNRIYYAHLDQIAHAFGCDQDVSISGDQWEAQHNTMTLNMQLRFADRRTFGAAIESTYSLREEEVASFAGKIYLLKWLLNQNPPRIHNSPFNPFQLP